MIRHYAFFSHFNFLLYPRRPTLRVYTFFVERFARLSIKIDPSSKTFHHRFASCDEGLRTFLSLRVLIKIYKFEKKIVQRLWSNDFRGIIITDRTHALEHLVAIVAYTGDLRTQVDETGIKKSGKVVKEAGANRRKSWVFLSVRCLVEYETLQSRPHASLFVLTTNCGWAKKVRPRFLRNVFNISAGGRRKSQRRVNQEN